MDATFGLLDMMMHVMGPTVLALASDVPRDPNLDSDYHPEYHDYNGFFHSDALPSFLKKVWT